MEEGKGESKCGRRQLWKREIMNNLTPRGWLVLVIIPSLLLLVGLWEVSSHLWYVGEGGNWLGYCWGSVVECYNIVEGGK